MKRVAFLGDLHFYDGQTKSHEDYFTNCRHCMDLYTKELETSKPDYIVLSGDIVGLSERVMRTRIGLSILISYLKMWSDLCNGNLYSVAGNHDYAKGESLSDFDLLVQLGIIKRAKFIDIYGLRVHMIDYGNEREPIEFAENRHNIACMHANLQIDGMTTWFHADEGIALSSLRNLKGVELAVCGHIHNPSPRVVTTSIEDSSINLLYLGCPTRPKRRDTWSGVFVFYADCSENSDVSVSTSLIRLEDYNNVFTQQALKANADNDEPEEEISDTPVVDIALLTQILDELSPALMASEFDYRTQVRRFAGVDKRAAEIAISYLDKADEFAKVKS